MADSGHATTPIVPWLHHHQVPQSPETAGRASPGARAESAPATVSLRIAVHDYAGHPFQFEMSRALARRGHEVRHFFFANDPGPKGVTTVSDDDPSGFSIEPVHIELGYTKKSFLFRFLGDLLYGREVGRQVRRFRPDIVLSGNAPIDSQWALKRAVDRDGVRFVFWVQDFYSLAVERALSGRWGNVGNAVVRRYRRREEILLNGSDAVVLISPDFQKYLPASLADSRRVHVVRNWGALDLISPGPRNNSWRTRMRLDGKLVIMYTGTLGRKHDPKLLLALSDAFASREDLAVVVVAAGVGADFLKAVEEAQPLKNLVLLPLQPAAELQEVLATADVLLAFLETDAAEFSVPSKLLSYLCAGRPIVLSAPPENLSVAVLTESQGGIAVPSGNAEAFTVAVRSLLQDSDRRAACGRAGRSYAEAHFGISEIAKRFETIFESARGL